MVFPRSCVLLTGPIGSGKTRSLRMAVEQLAQAGRRVAAVIQPDEGRRPDGAATGFSMEFLSGAEGRLKAERIALARELREGELPAAGSLALGRFVFEPAVFARAESFFSEAMDGEGGPEVLGMDEIGRLELQRGDGLMPCLELVLEAVAGGSGPRLLVCSAREDCVAELRHLVQAAGLRTETFEPPRVHELLRTISRELEA
jgi:nucleoside-triphosphatase THEP1